MCSRQPCEIEGENAEYTPTILDFLGCMAVPLWKEWSTKMEAMGLDGSGNFSLRGVCPHCKHDSVFIRVTSNYMEATGRAYGAGYEYLLVAVLRCQGCLLFVMGAVTHVGTQLVYEYVAHYPLNTPDDSVADEIPAHIKPDLAEALRCLSVKAYNATGEMCRRALEASCLHLGAPKKDVLEDMIDWLEEKRIITPSLKDVAHKVRLGGNRCAHPEPIGAIAPIERIEQKHAEAIVEFTKHFLQHVFVTPKQLDKFDFTKPKTPKALKP